MYLTLIICTLLLLPTSAFAYVDPGTGMLLWQGFIAAIGALIVIVRNPITKLKGLIASYYGMKSERKSSQEAIKTEQSIQIKSTLNDET